MSNEIILRKVQALGIPEPLNATAETLKVVLSAYFTRRVLDEPTFRGYIGMLNPSLLILMEGLKAFSLDQSGLSHKVQNTIETSISVLKTRLDRPDITPEEAREIRLTILELVREAPRGVQRAAHRHRRAGGVRHDGAGGGSWRHHGRAGRPAQRRRSDGHAPVAEVGSRDPGPAAFRTLHLHPASCILPRAVRRSS